jgi:predicted ATP-grasp superfamily ATP-dependent carboligase
LFSAVWSLARTGFRVVVGNSGYRGTAEASRFCDEVWHHASLGSDPARFVDELRLLLARRGDVVAIYPTGDDEIRFLADHAAALPDSLVAVMPRPDVADLCLSKTRMADVAARVGVPQAPFREVETLTGLHEAAHEVGFPLVVKPTRAMVRLYGEKAAICSDRGALDALFTDWPRGHRTLFVQTYVHAPRRNLMFAAVDGELLCGYQEAVRRTTRLNGTGVTIESMSEPTDPVLFDCTARLVRAVGYTGIGHIQFLADPQSGTISFIELNPRDGATAVLGFCVGKDLPRIGVEIALGQDVAAADRGFEYRVGRRTSSIHADLSAVALAYRRGAIGIGSVAVWLVTMLNSAIRADVDVTWNWRDPMPALSAFAAPFTGRYQHKVR